MTERDAGGMFAPKNCGHPECNGKHGNQVKWADLCPGARRKQADWRKKNIERVRRSDREAKRKARGTKASSLRMAIEARNDEEDNEVQIVPGRCIAWTAMGGHCLNQVKPDELACAEHEKDFERNADLRPRYFRAEDYPEYATMGPKQREQFRRMIYMRAKRAERAGNKRETNHERMTAALAIGQETLMVRAAKKRGDRIAFIERKLQEDGYVSTADVCAGCGISHDTAKRLLSELAAEGKVERIYGGAKLPGTDVNPGVLRRPRVA